MTLIWLTLAFLAGALFWHHTGTWLFRKFALRDKRRTDLLRNINTETLVALRREAEEEMDRRALTLKRLA